MKTKILAALFFSVSLLSCDNTVQCERHFIPGGYVGIVTIYFGQKGGQKSLDKDGCIEYKISKDGKCFSALPFKVGTTTPNKTFRYFEIVNKDSIQELSEFYEKDYLQDTIHNAKKKYIFFLSSGYSGDTLTYSYDVDYGIHYKNHLYSKG